LEGVYGLVEEADLTVLVLQLLDRCDQGFSKPVEFAADRRPAPKVTYQKPVESTIV